MKRRFRKNKKKKTAAFAGIVTICACALFGSLAREDSLFEIVLRQAKSEAYSQMLTSAAPSLFYQKQEKGNLNSLMDLIFHVVPVYGYVANAKEYTTQSESEISYETIIAREAADENYVDETTGELVISEETK